MITTKITKRIDAPLELVFQTIADIRNFSKAVTHIVNVEFLTSKQTGIGTKFRETRLMNGKEASTILEVTEYEENKRIRMVSDTHGTIWDSLFVVETDGNCTVIYFQMEATTKNWFKNLLNVLFKGIIAKAIEKDMDAVKEYCEKQK